MLRAQDAVLTCIRGVNPTSWSDRWGHSSRSRARHVVSRALPSLRSTVVAQQPLFTSGSPGTCSRVMHYHVKAHASIAAPFKVPPSCAAECSLPVECLADIKHAQDLTRMEAVNCGSARSVKSLLTDPHVWPDLHGAAMPCLGSQPTQCKPNTDSTSNLYQESRVCSETCRPQKPSALRQCCRVPAMQRNTSRTTR